MGRVRIRAGGQEKRLCGSGKLRNRGQGWAKGQKWVS